ncbi:hypothetical protein FH972_009873 [Carpinus fangiana]|uniref:Glucan endo-1,3-beta-D-glucosidase n=1 Tax=Carpinus fangiana TaxID=176857 RepID=A0A660KLM6_9ROSI|nr:hypothetical protein FH972_009873 [Carpinus fangiana]
MTHSSTPSESLTFRLHRHHFRLRANHGIRLHRFSDSAFSFSNGPTYCLPPLITLSPAPRRLSVSSLSPARHSESVSVTLSPTRLRRLVIAVSVGAENLNEVPSSVLMAETWLRTHVLSQYPAAKITSIVAGNTVLCDKGQEHKLDLVLPSFKVGDDLAEKVIKPLLEFLQNTNSIYSVNPPPNFSPLSDESVSLVSSHSESIVKLGFFELKNINVLAFSPKEKKSMSRKLSFVAYSVPANIAKKPHPPLSQIASPPSLTLTIPLAPEMPPVVDPANPPFGFTSPPCNPSFSQRSGTRKK